MSRDYINTSNLAIGYNTANELAHGLNLSLHEGETVCLIGSNGIGKSTLLRTLCGELQPLHGEITIMGNPLNKISRKQMASLVSYVGIGTEKGMAGGLTVRQLVELGRQPYTGMLGLLHSSDRTICAEAMAATGISHKMDSYIAALSDGERQKAMIARALAQDTPIIYLDEPFSFLDPSARLEIMDMLTGIAQKKRKAILLTCHDVALSLRMASRLWLFLHTGEVKDLSPTQAVAENALDKLYASDTVVFSKDAGDFIIARQQ